MILEWGGAARPRDENFLRGRRGPFEDPVLCLWVGVAGPAGGEKVKICKIFTFLLFLGPK